MAKVYFLLGASCSGKTTCLHELKNSYHFELITKETTRARRSDDGGEIDCVEKISITCDIRYTQYEVEYGFNSKEAWFHLSKNKDCALVVNDIRSLKILKNMFGGACRCIYLHSNVSARDIVIQESHREIGRQTSAASLTENRVERIKTIHRKYIENIYIFDYVVLNVGSKEDLFLQLKNIVGSPSSNILEHKTSARIFVVCGSTVSGKNELAKSMQHVQRTNIEAYIKFTNRPKRNGDSDQLRHVSSKELQEKSNLTYDKQGYEYGISSAELWGRLSDGYIQILVLNDLDALQKMKSEFGGLCTTLFLHSNLQSDEIERHLLSCGLSAREVSKRVSVANELSKSFTERAFLFDHVLLNTTAIEDLYDQAFAILDHYRSI